MTEAGPAPARVLAAGSAWGRVNLLGEHTDYNDGYVLPTVVPLCTIVELAASPDGRYHARSATLSEQAVFDGPDAKTSGFARYLAGCLRALAGHGIAVPPVSIAIRSSVPIGSGLSSSAALEVAFLRAVRGLLGLAFDDLEIARIAHRAESEYVGVHVGIMDQMASSLGAPGRMLFIDTRSLHFEQLPLPRNCAVLVVDSNHPRNLSDTPYNLRREECRIAARMLGVPALRDVRRIASVSALPAPYSKRARHVVQENHRVLEARTAEPARFGLLMNASHASLRDDFEVSIPALDALVQAMQRQRGVHGARLTGAGFGGACVALVDSTELATARAGTLADYAAAGYRGTAIT
jgi:galactokinase